MAISIGDALLKLGVDTRDLDKGLQGVGATIKKHQKAIGIGMTAAGGTILAGLGISLKAAADFEGAMREVNTMMGLSQEEFVDFSKEVQALASDLGVGAVDSAKALYQAISAGIPKENVLEFLKIATEAAIGGVTDTETAVDGLTTVINAFKLPMSDAQKVADAMFTTVKRGKTTFEELSANMSAAMPTAAALGVGYEEVLATVASLTKQGVPTAQAFTQIRASMVSLMKPTKEMDILLEAAGFETGRAMLEALGYAETLDALREAAEGNDAVLAKAFGSVEALGVVYGITGENAQAAADDIDALADSTGSATDAFNEMEKSATRQAAALKASFKDVMITVGNVLLPILKDLLGTIKPIIDSIKNWAAENPGLTEVIIIVAGVIGSLLVVLGPLLIMLPGIIAFLPILGAAFAVLTGPVGLIIAAIVGLIAVGVLLWKNWDEIKEKSISIWNGIVSFFGQVWESIVNIFKDNWRIILAILFPAVGIPLMIATHWNQVVDYFNKLWATITTIFKGIAKSMWEPIQTAIDWAIEYISGGWNSIVSYFHNLWTTVANIFNGIAKSMWEPIKNAIDAIMGWVNAAISAIQRLLSLFGRAGGGGGGGGGGGRRTSTAEEFEEAVALHGPIAAFEHGGIAMRPMLATIAEKRPEAVIPLDKNVLEKLGLGSGGYKTANIYVMLDEGVLAEALEVRLVDDIYLRTGSRI